MPTSPRDVDVEVRRWLKAAYDRDARPTLEPFVAARGARPTPFLTEA